jgi:hypothetical protein
MISPTPAITSNGRPLRSGPSYLVPAQDSTPLLEHPAALRRRYGDDGFVWVRGVVPAARVWRLRGQYFSRFPPGYLAPGSSPEEGRFSGRRPAGLPAHGVKGHPAYDFVRSPEFAGLVAADPLRRLAEELLEAPAVLLPRQILRHFDSGRPGASRAHADHSYLDRGTDRVVTIWIPLGDCPLPAGGLIYQAGSHRLPAERLDPLRRRTDRPHDSRPLSHDLSWVADELQTPWSWVDYGAGDVAVHGPRTIHASLDNSTEYMRASVDIRFVAEGEEPDPRWLVPWVGDDGN